MTIGLGIDTGGTYTDAVLVDLETKHVLTYSKALTTRHDLSLGIREAVDSVMKVTHAPYSPLDVDLVGLSTTLATNAIVEGYGGKVCLILIGYDQDLIRKHGFEDEFATEFVEYVQGGHDLQGNETAPLDEEAIRTAVLKHSNKVESFAISGYFSARNPKHEIQARTIVAALTDLPVTCGHELSSRLNSIRRATTVALNAGLIPLLRDLISSVQSTLKELGIAAPLLVVKGDGSLMKAKWAIQHPVETILSGPAASIVGALHLSQTEEGWVVDMGGTTTDIAKISNGQLLLNREGATVGNRRTMVEAADVYTVGLGGDSQVSIDREMEIRIGPKRVVPLCLLVDKHPEILHVLRDQIDTRKGHPHAGQFATFWRDPAYELPSDERFLLDQIREGPLPLIFSAQEDHLMTRRVESLEKRGLIQRAGFTPTDALHVLKQLMLWNAEASYLGAVMLADRVRQWVEAFCRSVVQEVSEKAATTMISKIVSDWGAPRDWERKRTGRIFLDRSLHGKTRDELKCELTLRHPIVAVGAPAVAYMPKVAETLHTQLRITPHAEVANAIGAIVGCVMHRRKILITPLEGGRQFRIHGLEGIQDFSDLEEAVAYAQKNVSASLESFARRCGAEQITTEMTRMDRVVQEIFLETELQFTVTGRPAIGIAGLPPDRKQHVGEVGLR